MVGLTFAVLAVVVLGLVVVAVGLRWNASWERDLDEIPAPDPPTLRLLRWEGYDRLAWEVDVWVWGLPPPGRLAFVCAWPAGSRRQASRSTPGWSWRRQGAPSPCGRLAGPAARRWVARRPAGCGGRCRRG
jgi:hypothetical protein